MLLLLSFAQRQLLLLLLLLLLCSKNPAGINLIIFELLFHFYCYIIIIFDILIFISTFFR